MQAANESRASSSSDTQVSAQAAVSAPSISLPKGGGAIRGIGEKFGANGATGTGALSVPLTLSPGRSGFGPQLSLSYDSGAGNGPFGLGWSLALPSITRKTDQGLPRYNDAENSDVFIISGAEDLVPVLVEEAGQWHHESTVRTVDGVEYRIQGYRPRIEGLFARIEHWTNVQTGVTHWRSISRDNVTTVYGVDNNSRICDPADHDPEHPRRVFRWLISGSYDDKGNAVVYEYKEENTDGVQLSQVHERNRTAASRSAERYLKRIRYGNRVSRLIDANESLDDWMFEVVFDYGEHDAENPTPNDDGEWLCRHDPFSSYRAGFEVRSYRLCQRVLMFHHFPDEEGVGENCLVRSTDFVYRNSRNNPADLIQGHPIASFLASITANGYRRVPNNAYLKRSLPPVDFEYSEAVVQEELREIDLQSLENLPYGADDAGYRWLDLDGEGVTGILTEQGGGWFYKRNISPLTARQNDAAAMVARFSPLELIAVQPSLNDGSEPQQFLDLAGDGQLDLVQFGRPVSGYFERTQDDGWSQFVPFESVPSITVGDPNVRFVDLTGDGHADILITEDDAFTWYPSLAEAGFGAGTRVAQALDEEKGPRLLFADSNQSVYLADLSGDGLTDLVRIRNGEVCYWPNLGYGHFGAKVSMDNAPWFEEPDLFNQKRILLADIDGSGVTDIIYFSRDRVTLYFNQSGNSWSEPQILNHFPGVDSSSSVAAVDLLGNGTACLVWSSSLPGETARSMRYVDLMGGQKPNLLVRVTNNLGAETRVRYASSTSFYMEDKFAGRPWLTKLPFPVHVVERIETIDYVSRNRFVNRYTYHHGYFDGIEREFRGFGMVEQLDTEELAALSANGSLPLATNIDAASHVPPVLTRTWFHTGALIDGGRVSRHFEQDYYREGDVSLGEQDLNEAQLRSMLLEDTILPNTVRLPDGSRLPWSISAEEALEACRALKGSILRREIYALDGTEEADRPYKVTENNYTIELLQPGEGNQHAVFFAHPRESIDFHYERRLFNIGGRMLADPRVTHSMTLAVDSFGNVIESVAIGYGRRHADPNPLLTDEDRQKQARTEITWMTNRFTNAVLDDDSYRAPLPSEARTFELLNVEPTANQPDVTNLFRFEELFSATQIVADGLHDIPYENVFRDVEEDGVPRRRLIEHVRSLSRRDDLSGPLLLGQIESRALQFESYKLAFTPGLVQQVYGDRVTDEMLANEGRYVHIEDDGNWWIPSGRVFFSPNPADSPEQELTAALEHFFLLTRFVDPFGSSTTVSYDSQDLLVTETRDALGNTVRSENDYRVMQPRLVTDPNGNRASAAFDALGMVVGTAVMGKESETLGDSLAGFEPDLDEATITANLQGPFTSPHDILNRAGARMVYDVRQYLRTSASDNPQPNVVYTLARETHHLQPDQITGIQHSFSYSDGFGREIQKKVQAEPGSLVEGGPEVSPRWVGSGWTIFNNKGKPVRQYEPFFSATHGFEFARTVGVSPILFYDPVERGVATLHPNHTWEKTVFDPWREETWDVNDTVSQPDPRNDPDVSDFFLRLPDADYLPTWHERRIGGQFGETPEQRQAEQQAAQRAAVHANTPAVVWVDSLGRPFLTVANNRFVRQGAIIQEQYATRVELDIEGNQREVIDALDRAVMDYDYNMLGTQIHSASMEAGEHWMLNDVAGQPIRAWDSRGHNFRTEYDELHRPARSFVTGADANDPNREILFQRTIYGEGQGDALNHRGRAFQIFDEAGVVTSDAYDFKGNLLRGSRQLLVNYRDAADWSVTPALEPPVFTSSTTYDALNRPVTLTSPDNSRIRPTYNEANLLERVEVNLRGAGAATVFVSDIDYNAKGQRELIEYGNGVRTTYDYDTESFRLTRLRTVRGSESLQDLSYTYDPAGNITAIRDDAQQTTYFNNQVVDAHAEYTYDAIYRLIEATGREHIGQVSQPQTSWNDEFRVSLPHPHDGQAMRRYTERYEYDEVGNILQLIHQAQNGNWTRDYAYDEPSIIEPPQTNNRLSRTDVGGAVETFEHDVHGNMTRMPHLPLMGWDYQDQLETTSRQVVNNGGTPEMTYYVYDGAGQRVRKVTERQAIVGQTPTRRSERIYLGGFEVYREYEVNGATTALERESVHIVDDQQRVALVETRTQGDDGSPTQLTRYQLTDHLGSAALELDEGSRIISYEEYYPYGSSSYQAGSSAVEVSHKRYRYTGKERDEETGLNYHGARYFATWLGRWTAADPIPLKDGPNSYIYCFSNPKNFRDPDGLSAADDPAEGTGGLQDATGYNPDTGTIRRSVKVKTSDVERPPKTLGDLSFEERDRALGLRPGSSRNTEMVHQQFFIDLNRRYEKRMAAISAMAQNRRATDIAARREREYEEGGPEWDNMSGRARSRLATAAKVSAGVTLILAYPLVASAAPRLLPYILAEGELFAGAIQASPAFNAGVLTASIFLGINVRGSGSPPGSAGAMRRPPAPTPPRKTVTELRTDPLAATNKPSPRPAVRVNRSIGNAFRDQVAALLEMSGLPGTVRILKERLLNTPFGPRYMDLEKRIVGDDFELIVGGVETKVRSSRYHPLQEIKDMWLGRIRNYTVQLIRQL